MTRRLIEGTPSHARRERERRQSRAELAAAVLVAATLMALSAGLTTCTSAYYAGVESRWSQP